MSGKRTDMTDNYFSVRMEAQYDRLNRNKVRNFREMVTQAVKGQTVCAGSSLTEYFPINEMLMNAGVQKIVYNRGIAGYTIAQYDAVLDCVLDLEPSKLFINIGSNDLNLPGDTIGNLISGYRRMLLRIRQALPDCKITVMAYYPCCKPDEGTPVAPGKIARTMENVNAANAEVEKLARGLGCDFINVNAPLMDEEGFLRQELALDAIHFSAAGYEKIFPLLAPLF